MSLSKLTHVWQDHTINQGNKAESVFVGGQNLKKITKITNTGVGESLLKGRGS